MLPLLKTEQPKNYLIPAAGSPTATLLQLAQNQCLMF